MNTETREIRDVTQLSEKERNSGVWIPVRRKYIQKQLISDADYRRALLAEEKRLRKRAARLRALADAT
jgi:hypothetical protein